jgi:fatty-acyl-CoA synthase
MQGLMQDWPLLVHQIIDHAAAVHGGARLVGPQMGTGARARSGYDGLRTQARKLAGALAARGIRAGDRVATLAGNSTAHLACWYGIAGLGAVYHTVNPRLHPDQVAWILNHGGARALMFDAAFAPLVEQIAPRLTHIECFVVIGAYTGKLGKPLLSYESFVARGRDRDWAALPEDSACGLCYTSGTTGDPKGVLYSHRSNMLLAFVAAQTPALRMTAQDMVLPLVPMFHANFWGLGFVAPMTGAGLVFAKPRLEPEALCDLIEREGVTIAAGAPILFQPLLAYLKQSRRTLPLRRVAIGGAAVPRAMIQAFEDRHGIEAVQCWGMTELSPIGAQSALKPPQQKLPRARQLDIKARQGWPQFGIAMTITDDRGRALPHDGKTMGRLKVKGPAAARAYFKGAGADAFDAQGWFDTGDVATLSADAVMTVTDRSKDVIKSGGEWISSVTVETLAAAHPAVAEAAVIGIPHAKWGERPLLLLVKKPGARVTGPQLIAFLTGKLTKWWLPDAVRFVDALPRTASGKVRKSQLRAAFADLRLPAPKRRT